MRGGRQGGKNRKRRRRGRRWRRGRDKAGKRHADKKRGNETEQSMERKEGRKERKE
jgi:hypothetical protein